ncbi:lactococcin 972 family bacteriocin [Streptomyces goshikiensis]|uniref:lactococcin 972 family bacteriocin n=1 Tax=Streptomyces goshikiensis TaxID=1942 RepID=UPI00369C74C8
MNTSAISTLGEACIPASGGNWCYGWYLTGVDATQKRCYSNYYHDSKTHSEIWPESPSCEGWLFDSSSLSSRLLRRPCVSRLKQTSPDLLFR